MQSENDEKKIIILRFRPSSIHPFVVLHNLYVFPALVYITPCRPRAGVARMFALNDVIGCADIYVKLMLSFPINSSRKLIISRRKFLETLIF